jgi:glycosyltransferase involved in cell wall biosynthesis
MEKLLYLMHVPWGWVKQRPHFIAEYLNRYYNLHVLYENTDRKELLVENGSTNLDVEELYKVSSNEYGLFKRYLIFFYRHITNKTIRKRELQKIISDYDIIWVTHPKFIHLIKKRPENSIVVYDCMDDILEFPMCRSNPKIRQQALEEEKNLIENCDIIFTSALNLKKKLIQRYQTKKEIHVINNGIFIDEKQDLPLNLIPSIENSFNSKSHKIVYIGTIGEWIDIDIIMESLKQFQNIEYVFFGPLYVKLPEHEGISYLGPVEHKYVFKIMEKADVLIMPFKIDELTLSVNPVKLYEYIYSCKPAIATEYGETKQFSEYVYLYKNKKEYIKILENLIANEFPLKKKCHEYKEFAHENTWEKRVQKIVEILKKLNIKT